MANEDFGNQRLLNAEFRKRLAKSNEILATQLSVGIRTIFAGAAGNAGSQLARGANVALNALQAQAVRNRAGALRNIHKAVAVESIESIVEAYSAAHPRKPTSGYRAGTRFSGGRMAAALRDPQMYRAAADGIELINRGLLDKRAAQWHRLNFGALPATTPSFTIPNMILFGQDTGVNLSLTDTPSPSFGLPRGWWQDAGGTRQPWSLSRKGSDAFYVSRGPQMFDTAGIRGSRFLDRGAETMNRLLPLGYERLVLGWIREFERAGSGPISRIATPSKSVLNALEKKAQADIRAAWKLDPGFLRRF